MAAAQKPSRGWHAGTTSPAWCWVVAMRDPVIRARRDSIRRWPTLTRLLVRPSLTPDWLERPFLPPVFVWPVLAVSKNNSELRVGRISCILPRLLPFGETQNQFWRRLHVITLGLPLFLAPVRWLGDEMPAGRSVEPAVGATCSEMKAVRTRSPGRV